MQFTAGNNKSCPVRNLSRDTYLDTKTGEVKQKKKCDNQRAGKVSQRLSYDAAGNLLTTRDALGRGMTYTYNSRGQTATITDQQGRTEYFFYDKEGRQICHVDRKGTTTETRYNVYAKPVYQVCTDNQGNRQVMGSWRYDDFGHLKEAKAGGFLYTYTHRADGKLLTKSQNGKVVLTCGYYPEGILKSLTDSRGKSLYYTYDEEGNLQSLTIKKGEAWLLYDARFT